MAGPVVRVVGARRLVRTMKAAGVELDDLTAVHRSVGEVALDAVRPEVPVRSGRLRGDLRQSAAKRRTSLMVGRAGVPYALPIHWGWAARNIEANPFVTRGLARHEAEIVGEFESGVEAILDTVEGA